VIPPEGGLRVPSAILCDAVRSIDQRRLLDRWGAVSTNTLLLVEDRLRRLLGL
jgi:mRNA interferase MazF